MLPIFAKDFFLGRTFNIDYAANGLFGIYNIQIDTLTTHSLTAESIQLGFIEDTNVLDFTIEGINIDASLVGKATAAKLIPASIDAFTITNLTIQMQAETYSTDGVHYGVSGMSAFHIDDFSIKMGQRVWQVLIDSQHDLLLSMVNLFLYNFVPAIINHKVTQFNTLVANEGPNTFVTNIISDLLPLNLTSTTYPVFSGADETITVHLDGRFIDIATGESVDQNSVWQ